MIQYTDIAMGLLFVCYMIAFSLWSCIIWSKLSDIKDDLSAIRRVLGNVEGKDDG